MRNLVFVLTLFIAAFVFSASASAGAPAAAPTGRLVVFEGFLRPT